MNKKLINIHVRGGIGDFCLASIKFDGIEEKHKDDIIQVCLNTPDYVKKEVLDLARLRCGKNLGLKRITQLNNYSRESSGVRQYIHDCDKLYDLNLWSEYTYYEKGKSRVGGELWKIEDVCPEIKCNYYHSFPYVYSSSYNKGSVVCIQPFGKTTNYLWDTQDWLYFDTLFHEKNLHFIYFGDNSQKKEIYSIMSEHMEIHHKAEMRINKQIYDIIRDIKACSLFIGCDSGLKNIALLLGKPVIMINNPDYPHTCNNCEAKDIWFPKFYRERDKHSLIVEDFDMKKVEKHCLAILS